MRFMSNKLSCITGRVSLDIGETLTAYMDYYVVAPADDRHGAEFNTGEPYVEGRGERLPIPGLIAAGTEILLQAKARRAANGVRI